MLWHLAIDKSIKSLFYGQDGKGKIMGRNLKMPWSLEDTIENMDHIRDLMIKRVRQVNLDEKGEEDVREINFDFSRVREALKKQSPRKVPDIERFGRCPECDAEFNSELLNEYNIMFCPWCGQALVWTEN